VSASSLLPNYSHHCGALSKPGTHFSFFIDLFSQFIWMGLLLAHLPSWTWTSGRSVNEDALRSHMTALWSTPMENHQLLLIPAAWKIYSTKLRWLATPKDQRRFGFPPYRTHTHGEYAFDRSSKAQPVSRASLIRGGWLAMGGIAGSHNG
jgi:hypothetical protein